MRMSINNPVNTRTFLTREAVDDVVEQLQRSNTDLVGIIPPQCSDPDPL